MKPSPLTHRSAPARLVLATAGLFALLTVTASAQIAFTVTATANGAALGYTAGQTATFTFVLHDFAPAAPTGTASNSLSYVWLEETLSQPEIWSSVSGTGLSGTWTRPSASGGSPLSSLEAHSDGTLKLYASLDTGTTGMTVDGVALQTASFSATFNGLSFAGFNSTLADPTDYFSDKLGTYAAASSWSGAIWDVTNHNEMFTVTELTIASSAVPEPSTWALLAGVACLGIAAVTRTRRGAQLRAEKVQASPRQKLIRAIRRWTFSGAMRSVMTERG